MSRWVAASVAAIALTATAVVVSYQLRTDNNAIEPAVVSLPGASEVDRSDEIIRLEFNDAPLSEVVDGVENAYGVTLTNVPEDDFATYAPLRRNRTGFHRDCKRAFGNRNKD